MTWLRCTAWMALLGTLLTLSACLRLYPLGMNETEWKALSPSQQMAARTKQAGIDRMEAARRAEERRREAERKAAEEVRIAALYDNAEYGDIVECVVQDGIADFRPGWKSFHPVAVTLVRGEIKEVPFRSKAGSDTQEFWASLNGSGNTVIICDDDPSRGYSDCATVAGLSRDFARGISQTISLKDIFNGVTARCAYASRYSRSRDRGYRRGW